MPSFLFLNYSISKRFMQHPLQSSSLPPPSHSGLSFGECDPLGITTILSSTHLPSSSSSHLSTPSSLLDPDEIWSQFCLNHISTIINSNSNNNENIIYNHTSSNEKVYSTCLNNISNIKYVNINF